METTRYPQTQGKKLGGQWPRGQVEKHSLEKHSDLQDGETKVSTH
jgi:hypothetical protein